MSTIKKLSALVCAVLLTGCSTTVLSNKSAVNAEQGFIQGKGHFQGRSHFWVGGLGQTRQIPAVEICGSEDKITQVDVRLSFVDWLLGAITFGIYTPITYRVFCQT